MKRAIAGAYFAVVCLHALLWLGTLQWSIAAGAASGVSGVSADVPEMLGILVVLASPLMLVAALVGLVEPRKPVALITACIVLSLCADASRAVSTIHTVSHATPAEGAIAAFILLLAVAGLIVVAKGKRKPRATTSDAGDSSQASP